MRRKVQINNESIENSIKKDYKEALVEYILNAFEASATEVSVEISRNIMGAVEELRIMDNGTGINHNTLDETFESFLSSKKQMMLKPINLGRNRGRGRYAFISFANSATWQTVYKDGDRLLSYNIRIHAGSKDHIDFDDETKEVQEESIKTGTTVVLQGIDSLSDEAMSLTYLEKPLLNAFASFLYLKRSKGYKITIDGIALNYEKFIDTSLSEEKVITVDGNEFTTYFIKWIDNIKSRYFLYFLDSASSERYSKHTKFNNNSIEFCHSVYVESVYFDDFAPLPESNASDAQIVLNEEETKNQRSDTFKALLKELNEFIGSKLKAYVKQDANRLVEKMKSEDGFPHFSESAFDQERKQDLENVVKEIYCVQPRIFKGLKKEPQKSILGFLSLLLSTDERENVIKIIDEVTQLSQEERADLVAILQFTKLSSVLRTVKLITDRLHIIELLKQLMYENEAFATERDHIQKTIAENYWLFGEEFHLVSADKNFEKSLSEYLYILDGETAKTADTSITDEDRLRRPDIFICQKRALEQLDGSQLEQNIIVELKSPQIILTKKVHRQIEDYMDLIIKEPKFNSQLRVWRFIAVCKSVDDDIKNLYEAMKIHNKRFLTHAVGNFEIYSMTWDDVFKSYDLRYSFLLKRLDIDQQILLSSIESTSASKDAANRLRDEILQYPHNDIPNTDKTEES